MKIVRWSALLGFILFISLAVLIVGSGFSFRAEDQDSPWPPVQKQNVTGIAVHLGQDAFTLVRDGKAWWVRTPTTPPTVLAHPQKVADFMDILLETCPESRVGGVESTPEVDFASPLILISINDTHSARIAEGPKGLYLLYNSDVYIFPHWDATAMRRSAEWYRDKRLFDFDVDDVTEVTVSPLAGEEWEVRRSRDSFVFRRPERFGEARIKESAVELYIHELSLLEGTGYLAATEQGTQTADLTVQVKGRSGLSETLEVRILEGGGLSVRSSRQPVWFELDRTGLHKLDLNAFSLVDRRVMDFLPGSIERINLSLGERSLSAKRLASGWAVGKKEKQHAGLDMMLWRLTSLQYEYGPLVLPATAVPALTVELSGRDEKSLVEIEFYRDPALPVGQCWLRPFSGEECYPVDDRMLNDLESLLPAAKRLGDEMS